MRFPVAISCAAVLLLPAAASAQVSAAEQRMQDAQRRLETFEQTQRIAEVERRVDSLELKLKSEENLRKMEDYSANYVLPAPQRWIPPAPPALPADLAEAERRRQASLAASEERLRRLAEQQRK